MSSKFRSPFSGTRADGTQWTHKSSPGFSEGQQMLIIPEPFPPLGVIGKNTPQPLPEPTGVVHLDKVDEFMDNDVIDDGRGGHDQTPGEIQGPRSAAGTPALAGIGNPYGSACNPYLQGKVRDPILEDLPRPGPIPGAEKTLPPWKTGRSPVGIPLLGFADSPRPQRSAGDAARPKMERTPRPGTAWAGFVPSML